MLEYYRKSAYIIWNNELSLLLIIMVQMFSGEPMFAHVKLIKEKKLRVFPAVYSSELL